MTRLLLILILCILSGEVHSQSLYVGSKKFTESVILGEIIARMGRAKKVDIQHRRELGGTQVLWKGLERRDIHLYPEYTGTLIEEMFHGQTINSFADLREKLRSLNIGMTDPLGFNNTYAVSMPRDKAKELGISTLSDLAKHPELRIAWTEEFLNRADGWPGLRARYSLPQTDVVGMDHDLAYRGLEGGQVDVVDAYSTDAEIAYYSLRVLKDDQKYFPEYQGVVLYALELEKSHPEFIATLQKLSGRISEKAMIRMNGAVKLEREPEAVVASRFLQKEFSIESKVKQVTMASRILKSTKGHLLLVGISMALTILLALPLGILAARVQSVGQVVLAVVGLFQTIPSLALLVFMIPWLGIGKAPAIAALFLYGLLPIVRNTFTGLKDIPKTLIESAEVLGLPRRAILWKIELPLASRSILAGIKTSIIINIGTATLGALVGAGGYGQPILTGIRLDDTAKILEGAVPAAVLALVAQGIFELLERVLVPKGIRVSRS